MPRRVKASAGYMAKRRWAAGRLGKRFWCRSGSTRPRTVWRTAARLAGAAPLRTWQASSPQVTSRRYCRPFSIGQWPRQAASTWAGVAGPPTQRTRAYASSRVVSPARSPLTYATSRTTHATCPSPGQSPVLVSSAPPQARRDRGRSRGSAPACAAPPDRRAGPLPPLAAAAWPGRRNSAPPPPASEGGCPSARRDPPVVRDDQPTALPLRQQRLPGHHPPPQHPLRQRRPRRLDPRQLVPLVPLVPLAARLGLGRSPARVRWA